MARSVFQVQALQPVDVGARAIRDSPPLAVNPAAKIRSRRYLKAVQGRIGMGKIIFSIIRPKRQWGPPFRPTEYVGNKPGMDLTQGRTRKRRPLYLMSHRSIAGGNFKRSREEGNGPIEDTRPLKRFAV